MKRKLKIDMNNAAFEENPYQELHRILKIRTYVFPHKTKRGWVTWQNYCSAIIGKEYHAPLKEWEEKKKNWPYEIRQ